MITDPLVRKKAVELRKRGLSYNEIRKELNNAIAKSTLSLWLKGVRLKPEHKHRLYTKQIAILSRGPQSQRERRLREVENIIRIAEEEITHPLSKESLKLFGAALYWAEGSKTGNFEVTNSDPSLVVFMVQWFRQMFDVHPSQLKVHVNLYPQQNENDIKKFWSDITKIPLKNFGKSFIKPAGKGYKKNNLYYGTVKVRVMKGVDMKYITFGWIKAALQDVTSKVELTKKKWTRLKETQRPPVNL